MTRPPLDNEAFFLLLRLAGYLNLIKQGLPASREEADELLSKIGEHIGDEELYQAEFGARSAALP